MLEWLIHCTPQSSAVLRSTQQYSAALCSTLQYSAVLCRAGFVLQDLEEEISDAGGSVSFVKVEFNLLWLTINPLFSHIISSDGLEVC